MYLKLILFKFVILQSIWAWTNLDALCKFMFIITETIVNIMKTKHVSKIIDVFQRTYSCLLDSIVYYMSITQTCLHYLLDRAAHFFWKCKMYIAYIIYYCIYFPLCTYILYFDAAKFSIKLFSLIYFTVSVVKQRKEYEIVTETWPIKTSLNNQLSLPRC